MTWEALSAIGTLVSAAVILATAIAALIQIRELKKATQLQGFLTVLAELRSAETRAADAFVEMTLPERLKDPVFTNEIASGHYDIRDHPEMQLGAFWEKNGALVRHRVVDAPLFLDTLSDVCILHWKQLQHVVALRRKREPLAWQEFEYLAAIAQRYVALREQGAPPTARVPL
jgi:hypothetical protein